MALNSRLVRKAPKVLNIRDQKSDKMIEVYKFWESIMHFEKEALAEMFAGDEEIYIEIRQDFFDSYQQMMSEIKAAVESSDANQLQITAHTFKGVLSTFCATRAKDLAFELEKMGKEGSLDKVRETFTKLSEEVPNLIDELKEFDITAYAA